MSEQSSPPKPTSLRDRIAAFENKGALPPSPAPPPPRPKPASLPWKPKQPSPPVSPERVPSAPTPGGMSVSDALESIGRGGSLKERMAALQGKGAFGGPPPPIAPKPAVDRPKWKPPPAVSTPAPSEDEPREDIASADPGLRDASRSPPPRAAASPPPGDQETPHREGDAQEGGGDPDPEEEERQRRAAIAARMARLGGARFGMAPPIFAPKPVARKSEETQPTETSVVSPPPDLPVTTDEPERKDEPDSPPPAPARAPASMPVPAGPRRAVPPRKRGSKNAPAAPLPEPPAEEADSVANEPPPSADHVTLTAGDSQKEMDETAEAVEATPDIAPPTEAFDEPAEPEKQEAEEAYVQSAAVHVEEEPTVDDEQIVAEQPSEAAELEEDEEEEARRQRVAARLAQKGAFNPLAGPPPVSQRPSLGEPAPQDPLDVEDKVNVDAEEHGETISPPPAVPARHDAAEIGQDDAKDQLPAHRDGEHDVSLYAKEQGDGQTWPCPEAQPNQDDSKSIVDANVVAEERVQEDVVAHCTTEMLVEADTTRPQRITRPMPPPPINLRSKPTPPSSPPLSSPPRTPLGAFKADEEERPASPDIPPQPVPPPVRSGSVTEDAPSPPMRRSIPPPPRRTSVRVTEVLPEPPCSPPPAPTSPRPVSGSRQPLTPPIITALAEQEPAPEEPEREEGPPQPEDEATTRRRAIAERMARLGGIRFGAPPVMDPLSRPPLPAAPPPTSIPPDETEPEDRAELEEAPRLEEAEPEEEEDEAARKRRIAAKLAGMGGMRIGMLLPPPPVPASVKRGKSEESESEDAVPPVPIPAPPQRPPPTRKPPPPIGIELVEQEQEQEQEPAQSASERGMSDDGVHVEEGESELEEVRYSDAEVLVGSEDEDAAPTTHAQTPRSAEALPTPPPRRASRSPPPSRPFMPTIPVALLGRRPSATTTSSRQTSLDEPGGGEMGVRLQSEYVMVEAEEQDEPLGVAALPPPPPRRVSTRRGPGRSVVPALPPVPPPSAIDPPSDLGSSAQWEVPGIGEGSELGSSGWSEDSTVVQAAASAGRGLGKVVPSSFTSLSGSGSGSGGGLGSGRRSLDQSQPWTTDALAAVSAKIGARVFEAATSLYEQSKRALVGDGSYAGFVRAVLAQVPGALVPPPTTTGDTEECAWGHVVYAQTGPAVQRRVADISPGDVVVFWDARLKGHKGLQAYTQTVGSGEPLVAVVAEFEAKKSKVRAWQANQRVGLQTVENVSYRLEDLKSGQVKVYRVLEA